MALQTGGKKIIFALLIGIMAKWTGGTGRCGRGGGGRGNIRSSRLSQEVLRGISAAPLLPDERPE